MDDILQGTYEGEIILTPIEGWVGCLVWVLQLLNGDTSRWTHAALVLDNGEVFEAQPGGAKISPLSKYRDRPWAVVSKIKVGDELLPLELPSQTRARVIEEARNLEHIGYNWTTYFYLAAYRLHIRPAWLKRRVQKSKRMICSQAVDHIYRLAGVRLFDDHRMPHDLTPGDLAKLI